MYVNKVLLKTKRKRQHFRCRNWYSGQQVTIVCLPFDQFCSNLIIIVFHLTLDHDLRDNNVIIIRKCSFHVKTITNLIVLNNN